MDLVNLYVTSTIYLLASHKRNLKKSKISNAILPFIVTLRSCPKKIFPELRVASSACSGLNLTKTYIGCLVNKKDCYSY